MKYHATEAYDGVDVQLYTFLNLAQDIGQWLVSRMDSFTLWGEKKSQYLFHKARWALETFWV